MQVIQICFVFKVKEKNKWIYLKLRSHGLDTRVKHSSSEIRDRHKGRT